MINRRKSNETKGGEKSKMNNTKRMVTIAIAAIMMVSLMTVIAPTTVAQEPASLRIYGEDNFSAAFPYTNFFSPFDASEVTGESPRKDYVTFNPAYLNSQEPDPFSPRVRRSRLESAGQDRTAAELPGGHGLGAGARDRAGGRRPGARRGGRMKEVIRILSFLKPEMTRAT